jgi:hypothetical protein
MKKKIYILSKDGIQIFEGTEDKVFCKLLDIQPMSTHWAIKYEGYKVSLKTKN